MKIWIDSDACPRGIFELVVRAAERRRITIFRVANRALPPHPSALVNSIEVGGGFDAADRCIVERVESGDLVITSDIPLAAEIVAHDALGLSPRGEVFNPENVSTKLATRNLMAELRSAGMLEGGPAAAGPADRRRFADALDRLLTKLTGCKV